MALTLRAALRSVLFAYPGKWWTRPGSNRRPPGCKPGALPAELRAPLDSLAHNQRRFGARSVFESRIARFSRLANGSVDHWPLLRMALLRKEVIQPQVLLQLPCYDFTPITKFTIESWLLAVTSPSSSAPGFRDVTGGVYKARERIHRIILIHDY
jgi:hypothetical protein